jgi:hypothetical protein
VFEDLLATYTDQSQLPMNKRGYLIFENPQQASNAEFVHGALLGKLLSKEGVTFLVLNACRSAHSELVSEPANERSAEDPHAKVRAFGSFALEAMNAGLTGVVAMRYNVYVATAGQFVATVYESLTQGHTLGEAVTVGRRQLADQPWREIAYGPVVLRDWPVPAVYEAAPISIIPKANAAAPRTTTVRASDARDTPGVHDAMLPPRPEAGFFGRDETLLALDRAFDTQSVVLLQAYAGEGKTATAAEFARWYSLTGGVGAPVLFTSFEQYKPLIRVLDQIETVFGPSLEGINWLALTNDQKRELTLQVLKQIPLLWIWDNVEPVAGFPAGANSLWSAEEQQELAEFLCDSRATRAKFLLTSRRNEQDWLGELPVVKLPEMPMLERVQLVRALVEKQQIRLADVEDWRPLLEFTQGNPLTIKVLVSQVLRNQLKSSEQIRTFVEQLRAGETVFRDERTAGRSSSLGASLSYGFENTFNEAERKQIALLHLFQGFVAVGALCAMGDPSIGNLREVSEMTQESGIELLDRAAEVGLLVPYGNGLYSVHPAVPWFLKKLFDTYYPATTDNGQAPGVRATRAFAAWAGKLGDFRTEEYDFDNSVIDMLALDESNLLHARRLACEHGWSESIRGTMQGLRILYLQTGRDVEWAQLVNEIVSQFVDPETDGPLPGTEDDWSIITQYRIRLAANAGRWPEAERLQKLRLRWDRQRATDALIISKRKLDSTQQNRVRNLATSLYDLGEIQRTLGNPKCAEAFKESFELAKRIGDRSGAAACALNLGCAYRTVSGLRHLARSDQWLRRSLKMLAEDQHIKRATCLLELSNTAWERYFEAPKSDDAPVYLGDALKFRLLAIEVVPSDALNEQGEIHGTLGDFYHVARIPDMALNHYQESIRYSEMLGDLLGAGETRYNAARLLASSGRLADAGDYARAALRNFLACSDIPRKSVERAMTLIKEIRLQTEIKMVER